MVQWADVCVFSSGWDKDGVGSGPAPSLCAISQRRAPRVEVEVPRGQPQNTDEQPATGRTRRRRWPRKRTRWARTSPSLACSRVRTLRRCGRRSCCTWWSSRCRSCMCRTSVATCTPGCCNGGASAIPKPDLWKKAGNKRKADSERSKMRLPTHTHRMLYDASNKSGKQSSTGRPSRQRRLCSNASLRERPCTCTPGCRRCRPCGHARCTFETQRHTRHST